MNVISEFLLFIIKPWYVWASGHNTTMSKNLLFLNKNCAKDTHKFVLARTVHLLIDYCYTIGCFFACSWALELYNVYFNDWFSLLYSAEENVETIIWKGIPFVALCRDTLHKCWSHSLNTEWSRLLPRSSSMKESWKHVVLLPLWESLTAELEKIYLSSSAQFIFLRDLSYTIHSKL